MKVWRLKNQDGEVVGASNRDAFGAVYNASYSTVNDLTRRELLGAIHGGVFTNGSLTVSGFTVEEIDVDALLSDRDALNWLDVIGEADITSPPLAGGISIYWRNGLTPTTSAGANIRAAIAAARATGKT